MAETVALNAYTSVVDGALRISVLNRLIRTARRGKSDTQLARCVAGLAGDESFEASSADVRIREQVLDEFRNWRSGQGALSRRQLAGTHSESFHTV